MSIKVNKYANNIPIVERYINNIFDSFIYTGNYNDDIKKFNYFVLDPDFNDDNNTSYILRVYTPIKNYQVFSCGAGGHGGLIYGAGGNGGNYLYIDNINNNNQLNTGSYLITPGRSIDLSKVIDNTDLFTEINNNIRKNGGFFLIKYPKNDFIDYLITIKTIDNYKQKDWSKNTNVLGSIINISDQSIKIEPNKVIELIFILKKNSSFKFNDFKNLYYTRIIKISNNNNINTLYIPDSNNNYLYTAGNYDEIITIICYQNTNDTLTNDKIPYLTSLFDYNYASRYPSNFYINDYITNRDYINGVKDTINNLIVNKTTTNTAIIYNTNPDASLNDIYQTTNINNKFSLAGGNVGNICFISNNSAVNTNYMLKRYYMPSLFALSINLSGGSSGTTTTGINTIINKLGANLKNLPMSSGKNITVDRNTNEWYSGNKGFFTQYFKLYAYYPYDANVELNNTSLANGGYTGYWQLLKDEINYRYGANGLNDLKSPNYGTYGCGGQGGCIILDKNSNFTGSRGKNGVFILSFVNQALATIVNDNSMVLKKMVNLFISMDDNSKLIGINSLINTNTVINETEINDFAKIINNLFIHEANIHIDDVYITKLNTFVPKSNFNQLLAIIYVIHRIYYLIANNIENIITSNIKKININFVDNYENEKIISTSSSDTLLIYVCDKINDADIYIKRYLRGFNYYRNVLSLPSNINIVIIKEGTIVTDLTSNKPLTGNNNYNAYNFIIKTISYIFDIQPKDFKININVVETTYNILCLNAVIYAIIYNYSSLTETIINSIYNDLKNYNYELKKVTDKIIAHSNIFEEQNEFKLYFNNGINKYNDYYDKNNDFRNLLISKKAYALTKEKLKNIVNIFTIIVFIIILIMILWLIYAIIFNSNQYDIMPHLVLMIFIIIILIIVINYYNYSYSYKEFFTNSLENASQLTVYNDNFNYDIKEIKFNNQSYKITYIKNTSDFILYKNLDTFIILIKKGSSGTNSNNNGTGGTINIYDNNFVASNIKENQRYSIVFNNDDISINDVIKTNQRKESDNNQNIKIFYNNNDNNLSNNSSSLLDYYDKQLNFSSNINYDSNNYLGTINTSNIVNITTDINNNPNMKEIISVLFSTNNVSSLYYGSTGGTKDYKDELINKLNYPDVYGLGGFYTNMESDNSGIDGVCIIINKQIEYTPIHLDLQTLINMFNNNINKLIYDRFNKIYLIDNNVIYNNAFIAYRKRYNEENEKNDKYKKTETNINEYSNNVLMDVYFRFELAKISVYILFALIISLMLFYYNKQHFIIILLLFILVVIMIVLYFYFNMRINTRRDYYKYYWSKYNNDN